MVGAREGLGIEKHWVENCLSRALCPQNELSGGAPEKCFSLKLHLLTGRPLTEGTWLGIEAGLQHGWQGGRTSEGPVGLFTSLQEIASTGCTFYVVQGGPHGR